MHVKNISARLHTFHKDIKPGETVEVPKEYEAALRNAPCFGIELVEATKAVEMPKPAGVIKGLKDVSESKAIVMVSSETDLETLKAWGMAETRASVTQAIAARYTALGGT